MSFTFACSRLFIVAPCPAVAASLRSENRPERALFQAVFGGRRRLAENHCSDTLARRPRLVWIVAAMSMPMSSRSSFSKRKSYLSALFKSPQRHLKASG